MDVGLNQHFWIRLPRRVLFLNGLLSFLAISLEVLMIRALGPVIGTHMIATSLCIGTTILGLSVGYYINSTRESKNARTLNLEIQRGFVLLAVAILITPFVLLGIRAFTNVDAASSEYIIKTAIMMVVAPVLLIGPSAIIIGYCSPYFYEVMQVNTSSARIGASRCLVSGGIGSLMGSILPGLILIPMLGVKQSYIVLALITGLSIAYCCARRIKSNQLAMLVVLSVFVSYQLCDFMTRYVSSQNNTTLREIDTAYQTVFVSRPYGEGLRVPAADTNIRFLRYDMPFGVQSIYDASLSYLDSPYYAGMVYPLIFAFNEESNATGKLIKDEYRVLILGSAGGTTSTVAHHFFKTPLEKSGRVLKVTNVDIDPVAHAVAKMDFFAENESTDFVAADARMYLKSTEKKFDYILIDEFSKGFYTPSESLSSEFFSDVRRILKPKGVVLFNIVAASESSKLFATLAGNMQAHFQYLYSARIQPEGALSNYFLTASDVAYDPLNLKSKKMPAEFSQKLQQGLLGYEAKVARIARRYSESFDDGISSEMLSLSLLREVWK